MNYNDEEYQFEVPFFQFNQNRLMNYTCPICYEHYNQKLKPHSMQCGHSICYICFQGLLSKRIHKCPECREQFQVNPAVNQSLYQLLQQEMVYCVKQGEGCDFLGAFENLKEHLLKCDFMNDGEKFIVQTNFQFVPVPKKHFENPDMNQIQQYSGQLNKNKIPHGKGKMIFLNGSSYDGCFIDGEYEGFGIYVQRYGKKKLSQQIQQQQNQAEEEKKNEEIKQENDNNNNDENNQEESKEDQMQQNYINQKKEEFLTKTNQSQLLDAVYEGHWKEGKREGEGTQKYPNGDTYEGQWKNNIRHGVGLYRFNQGIQYKGDWVKGKYEGTGLMIYKDGSNYHGQWKNGQQHGEGDKNYISGEYAGWDYSGQWKNGEWHGKGRLQNNEGLKKEGEFCEGNFVKGEIIDVNEKGHREVCWVNKGEKQNPKKKKGNCVIF